MTTAVVTGGASGLGAACVQAFQEAGYTVASIDLGAASDRPDVLSVKADITDAADVARAFEEITSLAGNPTVCVNAAGIYPRSTLADATSELYRQIFDVNLLGTVLVDQAFARVAPRGGVCINVASMDGLEPFAKSVLYSASKAAVINLTAGIAAELAEAGIRVYALAPGYIATDRVRALNGGTLPADAADPLAIGRTCVRLAADGGIGLVTGQTIVIRPSAIELS